MALTRSYCIECIKYQKILYLPLKKEGFVPENGSEIFVRQIPFEESEYDLIKFFEKMGDVFQLRLMMNENGKENRGFAYVTYVNSTFARKAVATLNNVVYKGKHYLRVEHSLNNCRLFIGGIPTHKKKDQIWQELYKNGVKNIIDVIMYRSYSDRAENRGFVFVEFKTHEEAAYFRAKYGKILRLWDNAVIVDWSVPVPQVDPLVMENVRVIYLRNLDVSESPELFQATINRFVAKRYLEKVYKFKNYAFVHLQTREIAENLMMCLKDHYKGSPVEVTWAKPPNKYTTQEYRQKKVSSLSLRASPSKSNEFAKMTPIETCNTTNKQCDTPETTSEEIQKMLPDLPSTSGLNISQQPSKSCQTTSNCCQSTTFYDAPVVHARSTSTPYKNPSGWYWVGMVGTPHISRNVVHVPVTAAPGEQASLEVEQRCQSLNLSDVLNTSQLQSEMLQAGPSYSSLKSAVPEGIDPIREYQKQMGRIYNSRSLIFDEENIRREMAFMPRDVTFESLKEFIGDILDD